MIKALVPLGNPGKEYEKTYHNVGVLVARLIQEQTAKSGKSFKVYKPEVFMNLSGPAVSTWMRMNNLLPDEILLIHDEGDLLVGEYKYSKGGGSAGHNGVASVIVSLGTEEFLRLRIGIRSPHEQVRSKTADFVLTQWSRGDEGHFNEVAERAAKELTDL